MVSSGVSLTDEQKRLPSGMLLPSGEAGFFDVAQAHDGVSGINSVYPSPVNWAESGIKNTPGNNNLLSVNNYSGILHPSGEFNQFSNAQASQISGIKSFTLFNPYIHHYGLDQPNTINRTASVKIPYVSDYNISITFNLYS